MLEIKKYTAVELWELVCSENYKWLEHIPISKHRAYSYLNNPRLNKEDIVMFIAYKKGEMISYRSVLPDILFINGEKQKIAWFSGNWVHPNYRRQGISTLLMKEILETWNYKIIFTNYAPISKKVYDKTLLFKEFYVKYGARLYLKSILADILPLKSSLFKNLSFFLKLIDFIINLFLSAFHLFIKYSNNKKELLVEYVNLIDSETESFINSENTSLSFRNKKMLEWILHYPWLITTKSNDSFNSKYQFSSVANSYQMLSYKVYNSSKKLIAFIMLKERDQVIDVPYAFIKENYYGDVLNLILKQAYNLHAKTITIYNKQLVRELNNRTGLHFFVRKMNRSYFATNDMFEIIKKSKIISFQDGDGDCAFT